MLRATHPTSPAGSLRAHVQGVLATISPQHAAVATFLILIGSMLLANTSMTGGHMLYSLDDPYIHIALADRLRSGTYGINAGEVTSPSSSTIWPFLLLPAAGTSFKLYMPLLLNTLFGVATAVLLGRFASTLPMPREWGAARWQRLAIAVLLVLSANLAGLAFTGLEHNLQVLVAVAIAMALIEHWRGVPLPTWALVLAALGPAVRYELFAVTAAVALVLLMERRWRTLAMMCAGSLVLPSALALFLIANGNYPLPNSVLAKLLPNSIVNQLSNQVSSAVPATAWMPSALLRYWDSAFGGKTALIVAIAIIFICWRRSSGTLRTVLMAAMLAGALQQAVGPFGWFYRYEVYAVVFCGLIALAALAEWRPRAIFPLVVLSAFAFLPAVKLTAESAHNVYEQQFQMHRFVDEHYRKPVAVNDIGLVSIDRPANRDGYVLDLYGLASNEAIRRKDRSAAWIDDVTRRHDAGLAMVYQSYVPNIPGSWQLIALMKLSGPRIAVAEDTVRIYATSTGDKAEITTRLREFAPTLPPGVTLTFQ